MMTAAAIARLLPRAARERLRNAIGGDRVERVASSAAWSVAGTLASKGLAVLASILVARMLGKNGLGEYAITIGTTAMFQSFAALGVGITGTRFVAQLHRTDPERTGRILILGRVVSIGSGALCAAGLELAAPWLAGTVLAAPHLTDTLRVTALALLFGALNEAQLGALAGFQAFRVGAALSVASGSVTAIFLTAGVALGGLTGAAWAYVAANGIACILGRRAIVGQCRRHGIPLRASRWSAEWRVLLGFSLPAFLVGVSTTPVGWACSALVARQPGGYAELGAFHASYQWMNALLFLPAACGQVVLSYLSESVGDGGGGRARGMLKASLVANFLLVVPAAAVGSLVSPVVMRFYGPGFAEAWPTLVVALWTAALMALQAPIAQLIAASNRMWIGFWMQVGWSVAALGLTAELASSGSIGLAAARMAAWVLHVAWSLAYVRRLVSDAGPGARGATEHVVGGGAGGA